LPKFLYKLIYVSGYVVIKLKDLSSQLEEKSVLTPYERKQRGGHGLMCDAYFLINLNIITYRDTIFLRSR